ncbi:hypothetical protein ACTXNJ_17840 [Pseudomonas helleri]|uniref:hypothetical protein n=1 Tax=Pseudomonas helleri TaxID=1608996 RepID=UPI003FCF5249
MSDSQSSKDFVPGCMRCAKCNFRLQRVNLYMGSGTTGPGDSKTEPCPNGCGPLWPITWEQEARECWAAADSLFENLHAERDQLKVENGALLKDAERYRWLRIADWWRSPVCVIRNPKEQAKLGTDCPSGDRLDAALDAAMGKGEQA